MYILLFDFPAMRRLRNTKKKKIQQESDECSIYRYIADEYGISHSHIGSFIKFTTNTSIVGFSMCIDKFNLKNLLIILQI